MKKLLIGILLFPLLIFAVGAMLVFVGGGLNSIFKKDIAPAPEGGVRKQIETESSSVKDPAIIQVTKPSISYATVYYDVIGLTKEEIRTNKAQARGGTFFEGHDGATTAETHINFKRRQLANTCETAMNEFNFKLTYTYPRLILLASISPEIKTDWDRFTTALKVHEEGHGKIEIERAEFMLRELQKIPAYATCEEFDRAWKAKANAIDLETKQIEEAYDRDTQSGKTQGLVF